MQNESILYLECKSGISGDMVVAALLDLGIDRDYFEKAIQSLNLEGASFTISRVDKKGIMACDFDVHIDGEISGEKLGDHAHHHHEHGHGDHSHAQGKDSHHNHDHPHRNLADVYEIIDRGSFSEQAKILAKKIFLILAEAEAKVHGKNIQEIHFHEVGALDSIMDIVGAALCIDALGIERIIFSPLSEGSGFVHCQHGKLPVPVPATCEIARRYAISLEMTATPHEMVTPTGIAIAAALKTGDKLPHVFVIEKIGYGAGKRELPHANVLRAMVIREKKKTETEDEILLLETNIDDSTGEELGLAMEALFEGGALDVHYIPVFMKKNRPAWLLRIMAKKEDGKRLEEIVFRTTSAIGIRKYLLARSILKREILSLSMPFGEVFVKKCSHGDSVFYYPEYESVKEFSGKTGFGFQELLLEIRKEAEKVFGKF